MKNKASKDFQDWHDKLAMVMGEDKMLGWYQKMFPVMVEYIKALEKASDEYRKATTGLINLAQKELHHD